jgi:hypothetical protein
MGSFNYTCCVSNLPIEAGTPVRYLALARSAFDTAGNGHVCYVGGRWQVYGVPIRGRYNDYGSVEEIEESFTTQMFFEGLKRGVVEKGVGDNTVHDVEVRVDMDQKGWLDALWEGRVDVEDLKPGPGPWAEPKPKPGVPSLKRIETLLRAANLEVVVGYGTKGYYVDEASPGYLRIRHGEGRTGRDTKDLDAILPLLHGAGYAAMITVGTGNYANHAEVLVAPLPPKDPSQHIVVQGLKQDREYNPIRPVSQAMIREDVWQLLLTMKIEHWDGNVYTAQYVRELATQYVEAEIERKANFESLTQEQRVDYLRKDRLGDHDGDFDPPTKPTFAQYLRGHEGTSGFTFREGYRLAAKLSPSPEALKQYALDLADLIFVQWAYSTLYGQWHPTSNGHQDSFWDQHRAFHASLAEIKGRWEEEDDESELEEDKEE